MVAGNYHHPSLDDKLTSRILVNTPAASTTSLLAQNAKVCEDQCRSVPQLRAIGASDWYFGRKNTSVATSVASADGG